MPNADSTPIIFAIGIVVSIGFFVFACLDPRLALRRKIALGTMALAQLFLGGICAFGVQPFHHWPATVWMVLMIVALAIGLSGPREKTA